MIYEVFTRCEIVLGFDGFRENRFTHQKVTHYQYRVVDKMSLKINVKRSKIANGDTTIISNDHLTKMSAPVANQSDSANGIVICETSQSLCLWKGGLVERGLLFILFKVKSLLSMQGR